MAKYGDMVIVTPDAGDLEPIRRLVRDQAGQTWVALGNPDVKNFKFLESPSDLGCEAIWDDDELLSDVPSHGDKPHLHMGWTFETV